MIPNLDFDNFLLNELPPDKRSFPYWKATFRGYLSQCKRLYNIFKNRVNGTVCTEWSNSTSYSLDVEVFYQFSVYKSLVGSNFGNIPDLNPTKWQLIQTTELGTELRSKFTFNKMIFEYALNKYFLKALNSNGYVGFKQPNSATSPANSDIYVGTNVITYPSFISGVTEATSDSSGYDSSTRYSTYDEDFSALVSNHFTIYIPSTVFSTISSDPIVAETIVRRFADKYVITGMIYKVQTY